MENTKIIVGRRFDELVKALNLSIPLFAKALGYERCDKLYNIQKGKYYPSFEILQDITKYFVNINTDWIVSGRGSMLREEQPVTAVPVVADESLLYKMYKEEKAEKEVLIEQIGALKLTVRQQEEKILGLRQMEEAPFQKDSTESTPIRKKGAAGLGSAQFAGK